jgi:hypothetical protein
MLCKADGSYYWLHTYIDPSLAPYLDLDGIGMEGYIGLVLVQKECNALLSLY